MRCNHLIGAGTIFGGGGLLIVAGTVWGACQGGGLLGAGPSTVEYGFLGGGLLFILGLNLRGVGPVRGLRGGGRRGWCK